MNLSQIDYLIFAAEKREISYFLKNSHKINEKIFFQVISNKKILLIVTGVGKKSVKKTLTETQDLLEPLTKVKTFNLGNAGALKQTNKSTILRIGASKGNNGKEKIITDNNHYVENITVNSIQDKKRLAQQFPNSYTVDMELFHLAKKYPKIISYKIILDTFKVKPNSLNFKFFLPFLIRKNSKLMYTFFIHKHCK